MLAESTKHMQDKVSTALLPVRNSIMRDDNQVLLSHAGSRTSWHC